MLLICVGLCVDVLFFWWMIIFPKKILLYLDQLASTQLTKRQFPSGKKESDEVVQVKLYVNTGPSSFQLAKKCLRCTIRESNPGRIDGNDP